MSQDPNNLVSELYNLEECGNLTIAELIKLVRKKTGITNENIRFQNLEDQLQFQNQKIEEWMQSQNQKIEEYSSAFLKMELMMNQMMELMKNSQSKGKEAVAPETHYVANGSRANQIEISNNRVESRGILSLPRGRETGNSSNSSQSSGSQNLKLRVEMPQFDGANS